MFIAYDKYGRITMFSPTPSEKKLSVKEKKEWDDKYGDFELDTKTKKEMLKMIRQRNKKRKAKK